MAYVRKKPNHAQVFSHVAPLVDSKYDLLGSKQARRDAVGTDKRYTYIYIHIGTNPCYCYFCYYKYYGY